MATSEAKEALRREMRAVLKKNREAFEGRYKEELNSLLALSREDIDEITPDLTDLAVYDQLIEVVKDASRKNLAQAQLRTRIRELGEVAVGIARKVAGLGTIVR